MSKDKFDKETKTVFDKGQALKDMTDTKGWQFAKKKVLDRAREYLSTMDIDVAKTSAETIVHQIEVQQAVARELILWVQEIEGDVQQHQSNSNIFRQMQEEYIINVEDLKS